MKNKKKVSAAGIDPKPPIKLKPPRVVARGKNWRILSTGLQFKGKVSGEVWLKVGWDIAVRHSVTSWAIGDHINFGSYEKYGEKYAQAQRNSRLTSQALRDLSWVCRRVEMSRRREDLSFGHHREVASLKPEEQICWLGEAAKARWSVEQFRKRLRRARKEEVTPAKAPAAGPLTTAGVVEEFLHETKGRTEPRTIARYVAGVPAKEVRFRRDALMPLKHLWDLLTARLESGDAKAPGAPAKEPGEKKAAD